MSTLKPKSRRRKIAKPAESEPQQPELNLTHHLSPEQKQAVQAMAAQGLAPDVIAAALGIPFDELGLTRMPETRVGRVAHILFKDLEEITGVTERRHFPSLKGLSKKEAVLAAYAVCGQIGKAIEYADVARCLHYRWLDEDPEYAAAFEAARKHVGLVVRDEIFRRAVDGTLNPVFFQGQLVGYELKHSDSLLAMLGKAHFPDEFGDKSKVEHTGLNIPPAITVRFIDAHGNVLAEGEDDQ